MPQQSSQSDHRAAVAWLDRLTAVLGEMPEGYELHASAEDQTIKLIDSAQHGDWVRGEGAFRPAEGTDQYDYFPSRFNEPVVASTPHQPRLHTGR